MICNSFLPVVLLVFSSSFFCLKFIVLCCSIFSFSFLKYLISILVQIDDNSNNNSSKKKQHDNLSSFLSIFNHHYICRLTELVIDFPANVAFVSFFSSCFRLVPFGQTKSLWRNVAGLYHWYSSFWRQIYNQTNGSDTNKACAIAMWHHAYRF
jgi:hypothetical protein